MTRSSSTPLRLDQGGTGCYDIDGVRQVFGILPPIPGPQGDPGADGADGDQGIQGIQGPEGPPGLTEIASTDITDSTSVGRSVLTAANAGAARTAIGAGTGSSNFDGVYSSLSSIPVTFPPIIGAGGTQAVAGNDARLTDARAPTAHATVHQNGGGDEISVAGLSGVLADPQPPIIGAGATQAVAGNDARLTDARAPTAHTQAASTISDATAAGIAVLTAGTASPVRSFIRGGLVTRSSATAIAVSACDYWDDTTGAIVSYAGGTNSPSLGVSLRYSVFLANGAIEVFQEDPPSTAYAGTARKRATGNGGRFIGWFLSNASSQIHSMDVVEIANAVKVVFKETTSSAPFRVLSGGTSTSYAAVSLAGCVPRYIATSALMTQYLNYSTTAGDGLLAELSLDGTNRFGAVEMYVPSTAAFPNLTGELPLEIATPQVHYRLSVRGSAAGPAFYLDVSGFTMSR